MTTLRHLDEATLRECFLVSQRASRGLSPDEAGELRKLQETAKQRQRDELAEARPEGRIVRPFRISPHE